MAVLVDSPFAFTHASKLFFAFRHSFYRFQFKGQDINNYCIKDRSQLIPSAFVIISKFTFHSLLYYFTFYLSTLSTLFHFFLPVIFLPIFFSPPLHSALLYIFYISLHLLKHLIWSYNSPGIYPSLFFKYRIVWQLFIFYQNMHSISLNLLRLVFIYRIPNIFPSLFFY